MAKIGCINTKPISIMSKTKSKEDLALEEKILDQKIF
jgi:hypothetical protein